MAASLTAFLVGAGLSASTAATVATGVSIAATAGSLAATGLAISSALSGPSVPGVPGVPDTPLSDPAKTQAELDIEARKVRVKRARLSQGAGGGTNTSPLGLPSSIGTQATLPKLTGQ